MAEQPTSSREIIHQTLEGTSALQQKISDMADEAMREIILLSHGLDPRLYDNAQICQGLFELVRRNRYCKIRILIANLDGIRHHGHQLLNLARRTSSFIQVRLQGIRFREERREWLISDTRHVLYREHAERHAGVYSPDNRPWAIELNRQFVDMWEHAEEDPDLRQISI